MLSRSLNTAAAFRLLAWPRYDDALEELGALVRNYASVLAGQGDACLCLLHTPEDPPIAASSLQAEVDKILAPEESIKIILVNDDTAPERWREFGVLIQAVAALPSSATGSRAEFVSAVGVPVVRDSVALAALRDQLHAASDKTKAAQLAATVTSPDGALFAVDLCDAAPLQAITVELTSKCDLRCVYCPKSDKELEKTSGRNMDMSQDNVQKAAAATAALAPEMVVLGGTGETTTRRDWMECCKLFKNGSRPLFNINSNFARVLSDEEISYLAEFDLIQISIDTTDEHLLRQMRRKVSLQTIAS